MVLAGTFDACFSAHRGSACGFRYSSIPVALFDNPGISKCFYTLFLLSPHLCFVIGFICDLSVVWFMDELEDLHTDTTNM